MTEIVNEGFLKESYELDDFVQGIEEDEGSQAESYEVLDEISNRDGAVRLVVIEFPDKTLYSVTTGEDWDPAIVTEVAEEADDIFNALSRKR